MGSRFPGHYGIPETPWGTIQGVSDSEFKIHDTVGLPTAVYTADAVTVTSTPGVVNGVTVAWLAISGATSYQIYYAFSLFPAHATLVATVAGTVLTYAFQYPMSVPSDVYPQVWVKAVVGTSEVYVQAFPSSFDGSLNSFAREETPLEPAYVALTVDNDYMRFMLAEQRRRHIATMQNNGEDFEIYMKRWTGPVCTCRQQNNLSDALDIVDGTTVATDAYTTTGINTSDEEDPQYNGLSRCPYCWGVGIKGGYYYQILNKMRYGDMPTRLMEIKEQGIELQNDFNTWSLWLPRLHQFDIMRRVKTGEMFLIDKPSTSEWRGIPLHQKMTARLLPPNDPRVAVTNATIEVGENS